MALPLEVHPLVVPEWELHPVLALEARTRTRCFLSVLRLQRRPSQALLWQA